MRRRRHDAALIGTTVLHNIPEAIGALEHAATESVIFLSQAAHVTVLAPDVGDVVGSGDLVHALVDLIGWKVGGASEEHVCHEGEEDGDEVHVWVWLW